MKSLKRDIIYSRTHIMLVLKKIYAANIIHISISEILQGDTKHLIVLRFYCGKGEEASLL